MNAPREWCRIDANNKITYLDWDEIERLAEEHNARFRGASGHTHLDRIQLGLVAQLCISIREHILETLQKSVGKDPSGFGGFGG